MPQPVLRELESVPYRSFTIPKRRKGQERLISIAPPLLADVQQRILGGILSHADVAPQANGFVPGRSIITGAAPHVGRAVVVNMDLKDFFPSVTFVQAEKAFLHLGYRRHVSASLAALCTFAPSAATPRAERRLPQGACTSPALTNLICRKLDWELARHAKQHGFTYTRYADDVTFSGDDAARLGEVLRVAKKIIRAAGFSVHPDKTKVMRRGSHQEVTGLTVNERVAVPRREKRLLRAMLHNAAKHGVESQNHEGREHFAQHLAGRAEYIAMVEPDKADAWRGAAELLLL